MSEIAKPLTGPTAPTPRLRTSMTPRRVRWAASALALSVALSGCAAFQKKVKQPPCPPIYILSDAAKITKYRAGAGRDLTDVEIEAEIVAYKGHCAYDPKGGVEVEVQVSFDVRRGPANPSGTSELSYFIAIPKYYPSPDAKAIFALPVAFKPGVDQARVNDDVVSLTIPLGGGDIINDHEIYLGFQATPEELEINRRMKR
jgi:hypothetical protein